MDVCQGRKYAYVLCKRNKEFEIIENTMFCR